jgi:predicted cytidylate kinase
MSSDVKKNIRAITVSGEVASGKSTLVAHLLTLLTDWKHINTGQKLREYCISKGMTVQEVSFVPDNIHREFDAIARKWIETEVNVIVEGRMSGWLARDIPDVFRVYCYAPIEIRAQRYIMRDNAETLEKAISEIRYREIKDVDKFRRVYGVEDFRDPVFYSFLLDTSIGKPDDLAQLVLQKLS